MAIEIEAPDFVRRIDETFRSSKVSSGEVKLKLSEDVTLTLKRTGRPDLDIILSGEIEIHFPHNKAGTYGLAPGATKEDRSTQRFIIFYGNGGNIRVDNVSADGVMMIERHRLPDPPRTKRVR